MQSVAAAIAELNRYNRQALAISDPAMAALRISGAFRTDDPQAFAQDLAQTYLARTIVQPSGQIEIVPSR